MDETTKETHKHINRVRELMNDIIQLLSNRAFTHDASKLREPELSLFAQWSPLLSSMEYGSDEYKEALTNMGPTLKHHYEHNRHHPEHFENGITEMNLIDIVEMLADWKAAQERVKDGDMRKSMLINIKRFNIPNGLSIVLMNTARDLGWIED